MSDKKWYENPVTFQRLYNKYDSFERMAEKTGVSDRTLRTWAKKHDGIQVKDRGRPASWTTKEPPNFVLEDDDGYALVESFVPIRDDNGEVERVERQSVRVHRLVAVAHWGMDAIKEKEIHHRDGAKLHNAPRNLVPLDPKIHGGLGWERRWKQPWVGDYSKGEGGPGVGEAEMPE